MDYLGVVRGRPLVTHEHSCFDIVLFCELRNNRISHLTLTGSLAFFFAVCE